MKCHEARGTGHCDPHLAGGPTFFFTTILCSNQQGACVSEEEQDGSCKGAGDAAAIVVIVCHLLSRAGNQKVLLVWGQHTRSEVMTDSSTKAEGAARLCPLLLVEGCLKSSRLSGAHSWEQLEEGGDDGRGREEFSFQTDEKEQGEVVPASLKRGNMKSLFIPTQVYAYF